MIFKAETLRSILWYEEGEVILNKITSTTRWDTWYRFIFKPEGDNRLFETSYCKGSTECQSNRPWEYEDDVECYEVEPYQRTITDYRRIEKSC